MIKKNQIQSSHKINRILVAEDESALRRSIELILLSNGYEPYLVENGTDALVLIVANHLNGTPFDLLLCDVQMPGLSGVNLISQLRDKGIDIPVVVMTGYGDKKLLVKLLRLGCHDFIDKPFEREVLIERLEKISKKLQTDKKKQNLLEMKAKTADRVRSTVHDLNNFLGSTIMYSELLLDDLSKSSPLHHRAEKLHRSANRAVDVCRNLLDFKPEQNKNSMEKTNINMLVENVSNILVDVLPAHINIAVDIFKDIIWYPAESARLQQALLNLGINAADAMPSGGEITFRLNIQTMGTDGDFICISVSDTGPGIDAHVLPHILNDGYTSKKKGYGIGLATVKQIMEEHSGKIEVKNRPTAGTCFQLLLPFTKPKQNTAHQMTASP